MGNFIVSGAAVRKAGANVSTAIPELAWTEWISGAESLINCIARENYSDSYATMNDDTKHILSDTASNLVAIDAIKFDMNVYTTRIEAEDMINILRDGALRGLSIIKDKKTKDFLI